MRHTRAFCHDASDVMRWTPQKWEPQATVCAWGSVASLRLLGLSARGVGGWGGHPALACVGLAGPVRQVRTIITIIDRQDLRDNSGSFAIFAAIRRASSRGLVERARH
jgi:hypothetical protein